ncbi:VIT1/CCC1 transporter family protein [Athalassotoga saccharophila]|uniref:VIT1/CCC1 transporter family protein n=1 Tax=Athalassotoga saccharophila TaxID=1441386 RepID=UPI00137A39F3|nr:VIT1/CCC1 transporter family protein [Athalassotoga saccharophila]BBJ28306.1 hypothetical protein ATHSA_1217 [Athalassotoga saccharophila]
MKLDDRQKIAREAFKRRDMSLHQEAHSKESISNEVWHKTSQGRYMTPLVYGASDGIITTFAVVAGAMGAHLSPQIVLIMGLANLFGDGFSMAVGDYMSQRTTVKYNQSEREREEWEVEIDPRSEKEELIEIYKAKGLEEEKARQLVEILSSNKKLWVETMMHEELNILEDKDSSPLKDALVTFFSFVFFGFMPLVTYILATFIPFFAQNTFSTATFLTIVTLFLVGALRNIVTNINWIKSGIEMLLTGGAAAIIAYVVGYMIKYITTL